MFVACNCVVVVVVVVVVIVVVVDVVVVVFIVFVYAEEDIPLATNRTSIRGTLPTAFGYLRSTKQFLSS